MTLFITHKHPLELILFIVKNIWPEKSSKLFDSTLFLNMNELYFCLKWQKSWILQPQLACSKEFNFVKILQPQPLHFAMPSLH